MAIFFCAGSIKAQDKILGEGRYKHTVSDSLITQFYNKVYGCFYNPVYIKKGSVTVTLLKIDIDKNGKVRNMGFSDSADPNFKEAFSQRKTNPDDFDTLAKYAAIKGYVDLSLLIPVYFEPGYPNQYKAFNYEELEDLMKFNKESVTGRIILLQPIIIRVAKSGNM